MFNADVSYSFGDARSSRDRHPESTNLLNLWGTSNVVHLARCVPKNPCCVNENLALAQLNCIAAGECPPFGTLRFKGDFELHQVDIDLRQNLVADFFVEAHLPIRDLQIHDIRFADESPCDPCILNQSTQEWANVKNLFNNILQCHDFKPLNERYNATAFGDLSLLLGWQFIREKDDNSAFKWLSVTPRAGILIPTSRKDDVDYAFSVPTGYNQHVGFPFRLDIAGGFWHWLVAGVHAGVMPFSDSAYERRMRTHELQSGPIKLAKGVATVSQGTLWDAGGYLNFDHFYKGLSFLTGYSFTQQETTSYHIKKADFACEPCVTSRLRDIMNDDETTRPWFYHTLHFMVEYNWDEGMICKSWSPRVRFLYDVPVGGKRSFKTDPIGIGLGLEVDVRCW